MKQVISAVENEISSLDETITSFIDNDLTYMPEFKHICYMQWVLKQQLKKLKKMDAKLTKLQKS